MTPESIKKLTYIVNTFILLVKLGLNTLQPFCPDNCILYRYKQNK